MLSVDERNKNLIETVGTEEDVARMRYLIQSHFWQPATSMPGIPHEYSLKWKWAWQDFREAVNFIWDHGIDARFSFSRYSNKIQGAKRYWFDHQSGWYYFIDPTDIDENGDVTKTCNLINRAKIESYDFWAEDRLNETVYRCCVKR